MSEAIFNETESLLLEVATHLSVLTNGLHPILDKVDSCLSKPKPDPVAYMTSDRRMLIFADVIKNNLDTTADGMTPLYEYSPTRKPLSHEKLLKMIKPHCGTYEMMGIRIARAIEKAHGIE